MKIMNYRFLLLTFLPKAIIFCFCVFYFIISIRSLFIEYIYGVPILVITPEAANGNELPAVTICAPREESLNTSLSFNEILQRNSIQYKELFFGCVYAKMIDPRSVSNESCRVNVVESIQYGSRKCFTFRDWDMPETGDDRIASVVINMARWLHLSPENLTSHNLAFTVHSSTSLPWINEQELQPLRPGWIDMIIYERVVTSVDPDVDQGVDCRSYDEKSHIRSQHDCLQMCVIQEIYRNLSCLDGYTPISLEVLTYLESSHRGLAHIVSGQLCPRNSIHFFLSRMAYEECNTFCRPACQHLYLVWGTHAMKESVMGFSEHFANFSAPIALMPSHQAYLSIRQEVMINFYNLIGYFGGHSHFWLGLSIITVYDFISVFFRVCRQCVARIRRVLT